MYFAGLVIAVLAGFTIIVLGAGRLFTARRPSDAPDNPGNHGLAYEDVTFESRYNAQLRGWWIPASSPGGTVVLSHGHNGSMERDLGFAAALNRANYNVLMFNYRAHGSSDGNVCTYGVFEKEDLLGAVDYLAASRGIERVGVVGFSSGAGIALIAAALTHRISALVLDGVFGRFMTLIQAWLRARDLPRPMAYILAQIVLFGASLVTNTRIYQVSPLLWARHVANSPTLFIHAENDRLVSLDQVKMLASDLPATSQIWVASGCNHRDGFKNAPHDYVREVTNWLDQHLR